MDRQTKIETRIWNLELYLHAIEKGKLNDIWNVPRAKSQLRYWKKQLEKIEVEI